MRGCNRICIGLAGATGMLDRLRADHPSAPRILRILDLKTLAHDERLEVIRKALAEANNQNVFSTAIAPDAEVLIAGLSEGYPHFIQQFGFSAFDEDTDGRITSSDVAKGATVENGALEQLGEKYYYSLQTAMSENGPSRDVLRAMAKLSRGSDWIGRETLVGEVGLERPVCMDAVNRLVGIGLMRVDHGGDAVSLLDASYGAWLRTSVFRETVFKVQDEERDPTPAAFRDMGVGAREMRGAYLAAELRGVYSAAELCEAGYTAAELRGVFPVADLVAHFPLSSLVDAGYSIQELSAVFSDDELGRVFTVQKIAMERHKDRLAQQVTGETDGSQTQALPAE